jgi:hypothetical protein
MEDHMFVDPDSLTWRFALGEAFQGVQRLVWHFDFAKERRGANYTGVPDPNELVQIINGFLTESDHLPDGDISELEKAKVALQGSIGRAYQSGQHASHQRWAQSAPEQQAQLSDLMPETVISAAWSQVPSGLSNSEANWFVEGFCRTWWSVEYVTYVRGTP